jgi:hypothetical protein
MPQWIDKDNSRVNHVAVLIKVKEQLLCMFWTWTLNKSGSPYHVEQTLYNGPDLIQCLSWSNRAREIESIAVFLGLKIG